MSKKWKYAAVTSLVLFIVSCGSSFQSGQKVWINLPGKSIAQEGYAVAKLIKNDNGQARIRVTKLVRGSGSKLQSKLKKRIAVIPSVLLKSYKQGQADWADRRQASRKLASLLRNSKTINKKQRALDEKFVDRVVDNNEIPEFTAALSLYRLRKNYLTGKSVSDRIANTPYVLRKLRALAQQNQAYQTILTDLSSAAVYSSRDGAKSVNVVLKRATGKRSPNRMRSNLFTRRAASTVREIRQGFAAAVSRRMKALHIVQGMPVLTNAEQAYLSFVTDSGKRYSKMSISNIIAIRKRQIGRRIMPRIRAALMKNAKLETAKSEQEAVSRYVQASSQASAISKLFGISVFPKLAKQQWFILPVRKRLARLKRQEKFRFRVAMNRLQPIAAQDKAIQRYLADYPQSANVSKIRTEQSLVNKRKEVALEIHERRLKRLIVLLTSRNQYKGSAGYQKKTLRFTIKINQFNKNSGRFSGTITWPEKNGAVNRITGQLNRDNLSIQFAEVTIIKRGSWRPGSKYTLRMDSDKNMKGTHSYRYFVFPKKRSVTLSMR